MNRISIIQYYIPVRCTFVLYYKHLSANIMVLCTFLGYWSSSQQTASQP